MAEQSLWMLQEEAFRVPGWIGAVEEMFWFLQVISSQRETENVFHLGNCLLQPLAQFLSLPRSG